MDQQIAHIIIKRHLYGRGFGIIIVLGLAQNGFISKGNIAPANPQTPNSRGFVQLGQGSGRKSAMTKHLSAWVYREKWRLARLSVYHHSPKPQPTRGLGSANAL